MSRALSQSTSRSESDPYKELLDSIRYGVVGQTSSEIKRALEEQDTAGKEIEKIKSSVEYQNADAKNQIDGIANLLTMKSHCLHGMLHIANLEDSFWELHNEIDTRATNLVEQEEAKQASKDDATNKHALDYIRELSLECIHGVENNWNWVLTLSKCLHVHLRNSADYHKYFHEIAESRKWMKAEFNIAEENFGSGDPFDLQDEKISRLTADIDALSMQLYHWQTKVDRLKQLATKVLPIHLRLGGVKDKIPARSLCNYNSGPIRIRENEDIFLLDNRDRSTWKVVNGRGDEGHVPALAVLIPGPDPEAIIQSDALYLKLRQDGSRLIAICIHKIGNYVSQVYPPDYTTEEGVKIREMLEKIEKDSQNLLSFHQKEGDHSKINEKTLNVSPDVKSVFSNGNSKKIGNLKNSLEDLISGWNIFMNSSPKKEMHATVEQLPNITILSPDKIDYSNKDRCLMHELESEMTPELTEYSITSYVLGNELKPKHVDENMNKLLIAKDEVSRSSDRSSLEITNSIDKEILQDDDPKIYTKFIIEQPVIKKYSHNTTRMTTAIKPKRLISGGGKGISKVSNDRGVLIHFEEDEEGVETDEDMMQHAPICEDGNAEVCISNVPEIRAEEYYYSDQTVMKHLKETDHIIKIDAKKNVKPVRGNSSDQNLVYEPSISKEIGTRTNEGKKIIIDQKQVIKNVPKIDEKLIDHKLEIKTKSNDQFNLKNNENILKPTLVLDQKTDAQSKIDHYQIDRNTNFSNIDDMKKEKSTDCDSALIPLHCVHG